MVRLLSGGVPYCPVQCVPVRLGRVVGEGRVNVFWIPLVDVASVGGQEGFLLRRAVGVGVVLVAETADAVWYRVDEALGKPVLWEVGEPDGELVGRDHLRWWWGSWWMGGAVAFAVDVLVGGRRYGGWRRGGWG